MEEPSLTLVRQVMRFSVLLARMSLEINARISLSLAAHFFNL
jgi:hypothetical protein